jgi:hypothetical protein
MRCGQFGSRCVRFSLWPVSRPSRLVQQCFASTAETAFCALWPVSRPSHAAPGSSHKSMHAVLACSRMSSVASTVLRTEYEYEYEHEHDCGCLLSYSYSKIRFKDGCQEWGRGDNRSEQTGIQNAEQGTQNGEVDKTVLPSEFLVLNSELTLQNVGRGHREDKASVQPRSIPVRFFIRAAHYGVRRFIVAFDTTCTRCCQFVSE